MVKVQVSKERGQEQLRGTVKGLFSDTLSEAAIVAGKTI